MPSDDIQVKFSTYWKVPTVRLNSDNSRTDMASGIAENTSATIFDAFGFFPSRKAIIAPISGISMSSVMTGTFCRSISDHPEDESDHVQQDDQRYDAAYDDGAIALDQSGLHLPHELSAAHKAAAYQVDYAIYYLPVEPVDRERKPVH